MQLLAVVGTRKSNELVSVEEELLDVGDHVEPAVVSVRLSWKLNKLMNTKS